MFGSDQFIKLCLFSILSISGLSSSLCETFEREKEKMCEKGNKMKKCLVTKRESKKNLFSHVWEGGLSRKISVCEIGKC